MAIKQISVFLENKSGRLYEMAEALGKNGINMIALTVAETADYGVVRFIADDPNRALDVLKKHGFTVAETDVVAVVVPDRPGGLASVLEVLKNKGLNVEYLYCFAGPTRDTAIDIMRVEDVEAAESLLEESNFKVFKSLEDMKF